MATCQGAVKGTRKDAPADLSNSGSTGSAVKLTANPTRGAENFMSNCVVCHSNKSVGGNQSIGSILITGPALTTVDSMKVILYALPTELSRQILI
jgi:cytochrome c